MRKLTIGLLALSLTACQPKPVPPPTPKPTATARDTFASCKWEKVTGAHLSIQSFNCGPDFGGLHMVADDNLDGFDLVHSDGSTNVIRSFMKPAGAPADAIMPAIREAAGGKDLSNCALVPGKASGSWASQIYTLEPTGAAKKAYDKANAVEPQDPPCGGMGIGPSGDRFFAVMAADPTRVLYVDMGSEIQPFDPSTIKVN